MLYLLVERIKLSFQLGDTLEVLGDRGSVDHRDSLPGCRAGAENERRGYCRAVNSIETH